MDKITLVRPNENLEGQAIELKKEYFDTGERFISGSAMWDQIDNYKEWLAMVRDNSSEKTVRDDWVVSSTFFALRKSDGKIVGMVDFRHDSDDFLRDYGQVGYSIRPLERGHGYASEMLKSMLFYAKKIGYKEVFLGCFTDNIPSRKTILKNNGELIRFCRHEGKKTEIFSIKL